MHEALAAYEADTSVVDEPAPIAKSRTVTDGALTMQVLLDGAHHRRTPDLSHTACGKRIPTQFAPLRREELRGDLCPECFTGFELTLAAVNNRRDHEP